MRSIDLFRSSKSKPSLPEAEPINQDDQKVILAIIGSSQVQSSIEQSLESIFIELVFVGSGEAAIEYLNKNFVSLVISEINLPMMNGLILSRKIKENESTRDVPVLLISDTAEGPDKVMGMETGADDYVTLPINPSELRSRVMALLSRKNSSKNEANPDPVEKEIFDDGILIADQGAGANNIPEDEIGLEAPEQIETDISISTEASLEEVFESQSDTMPEAEPQELPEAEPHAAPQSDIPPQIPPENPQQSLEEAAPLTEPNDSVIEEMLHPTSSVDTPSPNPLRPDMTTQNNEPDESELIIPKDDDIVVETSIEPPPVTDVQEEDVVQTESKPVLGGEDNTDTMLDDIFGDSDSKKPIPAAEELEIKNEQTEAIPPPITPAPIAEPVQEPSIAPTAAEVDLPQEVPNPVVPDPITPIPATEQAIPPPVTPPPVVPAPIAEPVQELSVAPTVAEADLSQEVPNPIVPPSVAPAPVVPNPVVPDPGVPVQVVPVSVGTIQDQEPITGESVESYNEFEIESTTDHKAIHQSTVTHLKELESAIVGGSEYDFSNIIHDASKIVTSVRQSNYLQIRAMSKRDGGDFPIHSINVTIYSVKLATGLKYETNKLIELAVAALLHDIGMLLIPDDIRHAQRKLSPEEISTLKLHPQYGSEYLTKAVQTHAELSAFTFLPVVALQEHERMNGTGYPHSIPGDEIHEYAKIISIIDMYEAVSHPSNYRDEYLAYEALQKVVALKDTHFDVKLLRSLVREISIFPIDSVVRLNDGQIGRVIGLEASHPMRPKLLLLYDTDGNKYAEEKELQLSKSPFLYVEVPISEEEVEKLGN